MESIKIVIKDKAGKKFWALVKENISLFQKNKVGISFDLDKK